MIYTIRVISFIFHQSVDAYNKDMHRIIEMLVFYSVFKLQCSWVWHVLFWWLKTAITILKLRYQFSIQYHE